MPLTYVVTGKIALDKLSTKIGQNLTRMFANLVGFLLTEHYEDGTHGAIHADSITVTANAETGATGDLNADGNAVFGGVVIAGSTDPETFVGIGEGSVFGAHAGEGVTIGGFYRGWQLYEDPNMTGGTRLSLSIRSLGATFPSAVDFEYDSTTPLFYVVPSPIFGGTTPCRLGRDAFPAQRWDEVNAETIRANTAFYERGRTTALGECTDVAYAAGNFTASGAGGWQVQAGDQTVYRYALSGEMLTVTFHLATTSVTAPLGAELRVAIPGGFTANKTWVGSLIYSDNGGANTASCCYVVTGATYIICQLIAHANWAAAVNTTLVFGSITLEVQ